VGAFADEVLVGEGGAETPSFFLGGRVFPISARETHDGSLKFLASSTAVTQSSVVGLISFTPNEIWVLPTTIFNLPAILSTGVSGLIFLSSSL